MFTNETGILPSHTLSRRLRTLAAIATGMVAFAGVQSASAGCPAKTYPGCSQEHVGGNSEAGKLDRADRLRKTGDSSKALSAGSHAVLYARQKYGLGNLVSDADKERAFQDMYDFLNWKLGSPALVASQWVTAGYQHFDKAYSDEAGASLIGFKLPGNGSEDLFIPDWFADLKLKVDKALVPVAADALAVATGAPAFLWKPVLNKFVEIENKVVRNLGFNFPKEFDIDNCFLETMIDAKRDKAGAKARLQAIIDKAQAGGKVDPPEMVKVKIK